MDYEKLLERGREKLPEKESLSERFNIPKAKGHIQGTKTVISNFQQIAQILGRDANHILKFVLRELATPGDMRGQLVIFGRKVSASAVNNAIAKYAETFVMCKECGKPDTKVVKKSGIPYLKCMACGAQNVIRSKIK
ncbi:MAG: translation initiation factor IF-2 subunit beta [Candidatus Woesearchaeota archaeon]